MTPNCGMRALLLSAASLAASLLHASASKTANGLQHREIPRNLNLDFAVLNGYGGRYIADGATEEDASLKPPAVYWPALVEARGICNTEFQEFLGKASDTEPVAIRRHTSEDLEKMSLEVAGWRVVKDVWSLSTEDEGFGDGFTFSVSEKYFTHGHTPSPRKEIAKMCRGDMWHQVRKSIVAEMPQCWRQPGYYGECEKFQSRAACEGEARGEAAVPGGCLWHEEIRAELIDSVVPFRRFVSPYLSSKIGEGAELWQVFDGESAVYRRTAMTMNDMGFYEYVLDQNKPRTAAKTKHASAAEGGRVLAPARDELDVIEATEKAVARLHKQGEAKFKELESEGGRSSDTSYTEANQSLTPEMCGCDGAESSSFGMLHIDFAVQHFGYMYDACMAEQGDEREDEARAVALKNEPAEKIGYALEMFNFWGPMETRPIKVNPLGLRFEPDAEHDPTDPRGRHGCSKDGHRIKLWYAADLKAGEGYVFKTKYVQHTSLPVADSDVDVDHIEENCRTSAEFRFWIVGSSKPTPYSGAPEPSDESGRANETAKAAAERARSNLERSFVEKYGKPFPAKAPEVKNPWRDNLHGTIAGHVLGTASERLERLERKEKIDDILEWTKDGSVGISFGKNPNTFPIISRIIPSKSTETDRYVQDGKLWASKTCGSTIVAFQAPGGAWTVVKDTDTFDSIKPHLLKRGRADSPMRLKVTFGDCAEKKTLAEKIKARIAADAAFAVHVEERRERVRARLEDEKSRACEGCETECLQCRPLGGRWTCPADCQQVREKRMEKKSRADADAADWVAAKEAAEAEESSFRFAAAKLRGSASPIKSTGDGMWEKPANLAEFEEEMRRLVNHDPPASHTIESRLESCNVI